MPLKLFGPGTDSGTFDFFTEKINGKARRSRSDYNASEDDNVLVRGRRGRHAARMGYFGYSYYEENKDRLKLLRIHGGDGCVAPSIETVQDGTYKPLSRPLFIYAKNVVVQAGRGARRSSSTSSSTSARSHGRRSFVALTKRQLAKAKRQYNAAVNRR